MFGFKQVFRKLLLDQLALIGAIANDRDKALKAVGGELDASSTAFHQDRTCTPREAACGSNIDRSPVYTMLLANHDLNEPYMAWKLSQFQQSQLSTLHKKLNIAVEVRVPLAILKRSALNSGVPEFGLLIWSGRRAWCVGTQ